MKKEFMDFELNLIIRSFCLNPKYVENIVKQIVSDIHRKYEDLIIELNELQYLKRGVLK